MTDALEKVVRPIVEGQIRGFLKEHPSIVAAVDWYKPRPDKALTFTNSLAKRIILDLLCEQTRDRIEKALFELWETENSGVPGPSAPDDARVGTSSDAASSSTVALTICGEGDEIGTSTDLVAIALRHEIECGTFQPGWMEIERTAA